MSRRRRASRAERRATAIVLGAIIGVGFFFSYWYILLPIAIIVCIVVLIARHFLKKEKYSEDDFTQKYIDPSEAAKTPSSYSAKESIMTDCEKAFFEAFKETVGSHYTVQPQINLASIIDKESQSKYRNELFRNIDFGIFDSDYSLKLLIEINDESHMRADRSARDSKVKTICDEAGIPLIVFWTKYGINKAYIHNRLATYLPLIATIENEKYE